MSRKFREEMGLEQMAEIRERIRTARRLQEVAGYRAELIVPQFKLIQGMKPPRETLCTPDQVAQSGLQLVEAKAPGTQRLPPQKRPVRADSGGWREAVRVVNARAGVLHWLCF